MRTRAVTANRVLVLLGILLLAPVILAALG